MAALISINNKLQQPEAARGVLDYAIKNHRYVSLLIAMNAARE